MVISLNLIASQHVRIVNYIFISNSSCCLFFLNWTQETQQKQTLGEPPFSAPEWSTWRGMLGCDRAGRTVACPCRLHLASLVHQGPAPPESSEKMCMNKGDRSLSERVTFVHEKGDFPRLPPWSVQRDKLFLTATQGIRLSSWSCSEGPEVSFHTGCVGSFEKLASSGWRLELGTWSVSHHLLQNQPQLTSVMLLWRFSGLPPDQSSLPHGQKACQVRPGLRFLFETTVSLPRSKSVPANVHVNPVTCRHWLVKQPSSRFPTPLWTDWATELCVRSCSGMRLSSVLVCLRWIYKSA